MSNGTGSRAEYASSFLDRLTQAPFKGEAGELGPGTRAALEAAVERDVTILLNTIREHEPLPEGYPETARSLVTFGLPDLTSVNLRLTSEQNRLRRAIETALEVFEPRLTEVSVRVERWDESKPHLTCHISAVLIDEPVVFEAVLRSGTGEFFVQRKTT
jgi:type VI secretion system protein ImpF